MSDVNKVVLTGRMARDGQTSKNGEYYFNTIAVDGYKDKTDFCAFAVFETRCAEFCKKYLKKGSRVRLDGRLSVTKKPDDSWETKVVVSDIGFLESPKKAGNGQATTDSEEKSKSDNLTEAQIEF